MQVRWKVLCMFGVVFWSAMCVVEYVFGNIIEKGEFSKLTEVQMETHLEEEFNIFSGPWTIGWKQTAIWGLFSFTISIALCTITRVIQVNIKKSHQTQFPATEPTTVVAFQAMVQQNTQPSKTTAITNAVDESKAQGTLNLLEVVKDFPVKTKIRSKPEKRGKLASEKPGKVKDKNSEVSNKLKEESSDVLLSTRKDILQLTKKLEVVTREKKEMAQQVVQYQKENDHIKQQLGDILNDRTLLIKRLECATREIKMNTSTKQMTLDKLEEAINCSTQMKDKIVRLTKEKEALEEQLDYLEKKYTSLKGQARALVQVDTVERFTRINEEESDISLLDSESDIQKVQTKLLNLEKSLEKMRLLNSQSSGALTIVSNEKEEVDSEKKPVSEVSFDKTVHVMEKDKSEIISNSKNEMSRNMIDENKSNILVREAKSYRLNEVISNADEKQDDADTTKSNESSDNVEDTTDTLGNEKNTTVENKESTTDSSLSLENTASESAETTTVTAEESESDVVYTPGIVSQSPAFQKFLLKVLDGPVQD